MYLELVIAIHSLTNYNLPAPCLSESFFVTTMTLAAATMIIDCISTSVAEMQDICSLQ